MKHIRTLQLSLVLALATALGASPALAQGKGNPHKGGKQKTEQVRELRDDRRDRDHDDRWEDDRWEDGVRLERRSGKQVPPGWCKGKGNPHRTVENCGYDAARRDGRYDDRRYDDRRYGSYEDAHRAFHYEHDRACRERASRRPLDVQWQIRVRSECKAAHDRWHDRMGRRHD